MLSSDDPNNLKSLFKFVRIIQLNKRKKYVNVIHVVVVCVFLIGLGKIEEYIFLTSTGEFAHSAFRPEGYHSLSVRNTFCPCENVRPV